LAKRSLGEALITIGELANARTYLEQALNSFTEMKMIMDQVACFIAYGAYYTRLSDVDKAADYYQNALQKSEASFPELDWRAYIGLANLAENRGDMESAVDSYIHGEEALSKIRLNFWQPSLAGSYSQATSLIFKKAIRLAVKKNSRCKSNIQDRPYPICLLYFGSADVKQFIDE
jgi:tetratricopeptide (TPR) repeat protein